MEITTLIKACEYYVKSTDDLRELSFHSKKTYVTYTKSIVKFLESRYQVSDIPLASVNTPFAKAYRGYLNECSYSEDTKSAYLSFIKAVITTIIEDFPPDEYEIDIKFNPFNNRKIQMVKKKKSHITEFILPEKRDTVWGYRDTLVPFSDDWNYCLLALFLWNSGWSFIDCCTEAEFTKDLQNSEFLVYNRHKGGAPGRIVVYDELTKVYNEIKSCSYDEKFDNWLPIRNFLDENGEAVKSRYEHQYGKFYRFCTGKLSDVLGRKVTPHILRHSFAVMMLDKQHSMTALAAMLGDTVATTEKYYGHISNSRLTLEKTQILNLNLNMAQ